MTKIISSVQHEDTNDVDIKIKKKKSAITEFSLLGRLNIMYAKIFLKPARAIEFIAIDFVITSTGASFDD